MRSLLAAVAWLFAVLVIALGGAGIVAAMDGGPSRVARPELTAPGDAALTPILDAAEVDLAALAGDVEALGVQARAALAAQVGNDVDTAEAAIGRGAVLLAAIRAQTAAIASHLDAAPLVGTRSAEFQLSEAVRERYARLEAALATVADLDEAWSGLTTGALPAARLSRLLADHDEAVLAAAKLGRDAKYDKAVGTLDAADAAIADARRLRNTLANTVDVSVLDEWLDRNANYDVALRGLYLALRDVGGRVTNDVRDAIAAEKAAKARLPPDSRGLILIMSEIGQGGMNGAVIAIEEARGRLADALEPPASPSSAPTP